MRGDLALLGGLCVTPDREVADSLVVCRDGVVLYVGPREVGDVPEGAALLDVTGCVVSPGFIDNHVHGGDGADITLGGKEAVLQTARHLLRYGTTGFLPTTVSASPDTLLFAVEGCRLAAQDTAPAARILGVHVEGPYINLKRKGAQPTSAIREPDAEEVARLQHAAEGLIRVMTLAPEIPGCLELTDTLSRQGITVSLGHSEATYDETLEAMYAGARQVTHLFNAMAGVNHRNPSIALAALCEPGLRAEVIADGVHLAPETVRLAFQAKGPESMLLITDGMAAVGMPDGEYELGDNKVTVQGDLCTLADGTIASSMLTMNRAVVNACRFAGASLCEAVRMASLTPAEAAGAADRKGSLEAGKDADIAVWRPDGTVVATVLGGEVVWRH
ncbi:MAG TPA: N-acetylglucosamine-6-phosphate deacetylase [Armatimonadota bacterium]